ncbi:MAG: M15 family metallopeptidase [Mycobacteriales bacterium]
MTRRCRLRAARARVLRLAVPLLAAATLTPLVASGAAAQTAVAPRTGNGSAQAQIAAMQAEVQRIGDKLAVSTIAYEADRDRLDLLLQQQFAAERAADALSLGAVAAQRQLNAVARAAYVSGVPEDVKIAMSVDPRNLSRSLDTVASLERVGGTSRSALKLLLDQRAATTALAQRRDTLRQEAQAVQNRSDSALSALQADAAAAQTELQAAQARLVSLQQAEAARTRSAEAARRAQLNLPSLGSGGGGAPCSARADGQYANGFLPDAVLCPLATASGERLANGAAAAFDQLSTLRRQETGSNLCLSDSYRDYAGQVAVFASKPSLAATPGRSQHGLGLAVDLCGGVERFNTEAYLWMQANAAEYGFIHPAWAEPGGGKPEPWHWEYVGPL